MPNLVLSCQPCFIGTQTRSYAVAASWPLICSQTLQLQVGFLQLFGLKLQLLPTEFVALRC